MSSSSVQIDIDERAKILAQPDMILDDRDVMRALVAADRNTLGDNIVDLRGIALDRLEARLNRLEETHRSVIASAYDNLASTNQVHRALMRLMEPMEFDAFLNVLGQDVTETLRLRCIRLVLETPQDSADQAVVGLNKVLKIRPAGFVRSYMRGQEPGERSMILRPVVAGPTDPAAQLYGSSDPIRSEALVRLDLGPGRLPGMLALGAEDVFHFTPNHGTDLLAFFAGMFERMMQRWLS